MSEFARRDDIKTILKESQKIAVVGLSDKSYRPSHGVAQYLQSHGYSIFPVNPGHEKILGEPAYNSVHDIEQPIDLVNVFRRPKFVPQHVDEAIEIGANYLWLQEGVIHQGAAQNARDAGLRVVMDRCMLKEHRKYM